MNVKDLKKKLDGLPDNLEVKIAYGCQLFETAGSKGHTLDEIQDVVIVHHNDCIDEVWLYNEYASEV